MRRSRDAAAAVDSPASSGNVRQVRDPPALLSGFDLYGVQGDAGSALRSFSAAESDVTESPAAQYNRLWLLRLAQSSSSSVGPRLNQPILQQPYDATAPTDEPFDSFLSKLEVMEQLILTPLNSESNSNGSNDIREKSPTVSKRRWQRNLWIVAHNRALALFAAGNFQACAKLCSHLLSPLVAEHSSSSSGSRLQKHEISSSFEDIEFVASCRVAMLWLECVLAWTVGKNSNLHRRILWKSLHEMDPHLTTQGTAVGTAIASDEAVRPPPSVETVMAWLDHVISNSHSSSNTKNTSANADAIAQQLKFLVPMYKSRLALAEFDETGKRVEASVRLARKDMKTAMEVFQNKLRPALGGGGSGQDASSNGSVVSSGNSDDGNSRLQSGVDQASSSTINNVVLQKLNQSALSVKAHLEQLKGNTKKSLILCSEAAGAITTADDVSSYEPLHGNNLAVVYETNHRRYLALHALSKSLRATHTDNPNINDDSSTKTASTLLVPSLFHSDGTVRPDMTPSILYNTAVCSLRARRYTSAYECMAACMTQSPIFASRLTCWLRLAEACMGIHTELKRNQSKNTRRPMFSAVESVDGEIQGVVLHSALFRDENGLVREKLEPNLGSPEDIEQVKRNPLLRACHALRQVVQQGSDGDVDTKQMIESDALTSARLTLSYVYLALGDHRNALSLANIVLDVVKAVILKHETSGPAESQVVRRLHRQHMANGRMYAAEACCALGDLTTALSFLVGDGKDDAFDRLASDLSGVTLATAATNEAAKRKLAIAQSMVNSSASAITAAMGNHRAAKQLAHSARAMEGDIFESNREQSSARRALIYTLLCEGNQSSALTMLLTR